MESLELGYFQVGLHVHTVLVCFTEVLPEGLDVSSLGMVSGLCVKGKCQCSEDGLCGTWFITAGMASVSSIGVAVPGATTAR